MIVGILLAFFGSIAYGITFNIKGHKLIFAGFSGVVGFFAFSVLYQFTHHSIFAIFVGAVAVGFYSESAARLLKSPSTIFSIPGILPLVPGITAYEMIQALMSNELINAIGKMIESSGGAGAIAFGIMMVTAIFRFTSKVKRTKKYRKK